MTVKVAEELNEILSAIKEKLAKERPSKWENMPDIELYMDQVISYMKRQHTGLGGEEALTAAMVSNYAKKELLPRAKGKKYDRSHIAYLTAICLLKNVLPVSDTGILLKKHTEKQDIESFYENYRDILDESLRGVSEEIDENMTEDEILGLILKLAVSSYAQKLACEALLRSISG